MMALNLIGKDFNDTVGEVQSANERSIKIMESTHSRLIQQRHSLLGSEFSYETLDDTKGHLPPGSCAKVVSQGDATEVVRAILDCPRKVANGTNRWNCKGRRKSELSV